MTLLLESMIHYLSVGTTVALTSLGVSIGQGMTCNSSIEAIDRQPNSRTEISRATLFSLALIETSGLIGFIGAILLFIGKPTNILDAYAELGFVLAISIPGLVLGIASSFPAQTAIMSIARQPFLGRKIMNFMLLTQSLIQTPLAFGFIIALLIRAQFGSITNLGQVFALISSGLCVGLGSIGPVFGVGNFAKMACKSAGINKYAYERLISFTIISQAIIETPVIFSAIISLWLLRISYIPHENLILNVVYFAAAFVMGIGTFAPGLSSGNAAASACKEIALSPQHYSSLARTSMIAQGIIDTCAIYAFIVAILIILS